MAFLRQMQIGKWDITIIWFIIPTMGEPHGTGVQALFTPHRYPVLVSQKQGKFLCHMEILRMVALDHYFALWMDKIGRKYH